MNKKLSLITINLALLFGALTATNHKVKVSASEPYVPVAGALGTRKLDLS